jgi:hypothetical protein
MGMIAYWRKSVLVLLFEGVNATRKFLQTKTSPTRENKPYNELHRFFDNIKPEIYKFPFTSKKTNINRFSLVVNDIGNFSNHRVYFLVCVNVIWSLRLNLCCLYSSRRQTVCASTPCSYISNFCRLFSTFE